MLYEAEFPLGHFDVSECKLLPCQDLLTDPYSDDVTPILTAILTPVQRLV